MDFLAYIDPGSGSLIIQAVIASVVAIPFFFRQQIGRIAPHGPPRRERHDFGYAADRPAFLNLSSHLVTGAGNGRERPRPTGPGLIPRPVRVRVLA